MRAGGLAPATLPRVSTSLTVAPGTFNEGRGVSPGDTCGVCPSTSVTIGAFNEGRGVSPGDTLYALQQHATGNRRSMRAGGLAPATPQTENLRCIKVGAFNEGRGVSPGDTRKNRQCTSGHDTFNEGRGVSPGDTCK